ncbi:uncharacterized protein LOC142382710 [Odontesthes bonariensis]|uniref:uncharacterized protein LOC142382710 n=1 Tax=Odontesthes bonariensis TaxID=219752 RepID=UPI003F584BDD
MEEENSYGDKEKSLLLVQIRYLEEQLESCQLTCDELEKQHEDLNQQYDALEKSENEKAEPLKRFVAAQEKRMEELLDQLEAEQHTFKHAKKALQLKHSKQKQELQEKFDKLYAKKTMQAGPLKKQERQLKHLKQQKSNLKWKKKQLAIKREEKKVHLQSLRTAFDSKRENRSMKLQEYMESCVIERASEILEKERAEHSEKLKQLQVALTVAGTLREDIDELLASETEMQRSERDMEKEFIEKNKQRSSLKKQVEQLQMRFQQLVEERKDLHSQQQTSLAQIEFLSKHVGLSSEECRKKLANIRQLETELQKEENRCRKLEVVKHDAAIILRHICSGTEEEEDRQWMIKRLLEILHSCAPQATESTLRDSSKKSSESGKLHTSHSEAVRRLRRRTEGMPSVFHPADPSPQAGPSDSADCRTKSSQL